MSRNKKKIVICGNGNLLKYTEEKIAENLNYHISGICESIKLINKDIICDADIVFLAVSWHETENWIDKLQAVGVKDIYRVPVHIMQYRLPIFESNGEITKAIAYIDTKVTNLLYLETHVADTCNLKCKGCMHFSNLATDPNFPNIDSFKNDFERMKELFPNIFIIRLMGGEPLINSQLGNYIEIVREIFPAAEIRIVTNGLLIPNQKAEFWRTVSKNYVSMDISPYPPTIESIDKIKKVLDSENIPYGTIADVLHKFRKSLTLTPNNNPQKSVKLCQSSHCRFLRNGNIAKCPLPLLINDFNKEYNCNIESKAYYDIYEEKTGYELKKKLDSFADMCRYCPDSESFIEWSRTVNDACMEDWVVR